MADPAIDGSPVTSGALAAVNSATLAMTVNSASSVIVLSISRRDVVDGDRVISSVTWNGSSTGSASVREDDETVTSNITTTIWRIVDPAVGSFNAVVNLTGVNDFVSVGGVVLTNVDQSTPSDASNGSSSTTAGVDPSTTLTVGTNTFVVDAYYDTANDAAVSIGASQTQIHKSAVNSGGDSAGGSYKATQSGSVTMTWVNDGSGQGYVQSVASFQGVQASGAVTSILTALGVEPLMELWNWAKLMCSQTGSRWLWLNPIS